MNNNYDESEEDYMPHFHNFSALNQIKVKISEPTPEEMEVKKKNEEISKLLSKYEMLYPEMYNLMFQAAINGEDLDEAYNKLKGWMALM